MFLGKLLEVSPGYPARNVSEEWEKLYPKETRDLGHTYSKKDAFGGLYELMVYVSYLHVVYDLQYYRCVNPKCHQLRMNLEINQVYGYTRADFGGEMCRIMESSSQEGTTLSKLNGLVDRHFTLVKELMELPSIVPPLR